MQLLINHRRIKVNELSGKLSIDLHVERAPIGVLIFMGVFAFLGFLIPVITFAISKIQNLEIGSGFIISLIIGFGVSFYLTRIILWNSVGVERYVISQNCIKQICDYRWFRDSERVLKGDDIISKYIVCNSNPKLEGVGRLAFESTKENIQSVIDFPLIIIKELNSVIEIKLNEKPK